MNAVTGKPWKGLLALLLFGELANFSPVRGGAVSFDVQLHCTGRVKREVCRRAQLHPCCTYATKVSETCHKCST
jgi:hypothetical protein